jgi:HK97 family phage prohead protease
MKPKNRQRRRMGEVRAVEVDGRPGVTLKVITPGVVDDYGTVWLPDVFDESLAARGPVLAWAHDWSDPLGPMTDYRTGEGGPEIDFVFSDFEAVPQARRAHAQVADGTIRDCSVGFMRSEWRDATDTDKETWPGVREVITKAALDEVSLVLRGAVPGAEVLAVRSGELDTDAFMEIARRKAAGELTDAEAKAAVELLAALDVEPGEEPPPPAEPTPEELAEAEALDADATAAIDAVLDRI